MMPPLSKQFFKTLAQDVSEALKHNTASLSQNEHQDKVQKVQSIIQSALSHLNLVTREEFDTQSAVLLRTREKVEQLEKEVQLLQQTITSLAP